MTKTKEYLNSKFQERYSNLNKQQKKAVDTIEGPLLVVAGPGSGKTEILSLRVAKILKETQALPSNVLCITFTDAASLNMRDRLSKLIGNEAYRVSIHTFHSFCVNIIQKYPEYFYKGTQFSPADSLTQVKILEDILSNLPQGNIFRDSYHEEKGFSYLSDIKKRIEHLKKSGITPSEFYKIIEHNKRSLKKAEEIILPNFAGRLGKDSASMLENVKEKLVKASMEEQNNDPFPINTGIFTSILSSYAVSLDAVLHQMQDDDGKNTHLSSWKTKYIKTRDDESKTLRESLDEEKMIALAEVYDLYRKNMAKKALFDFDDMILDAIEAIEKHQRLQFELQEQYQYVLIDEFQDTNNAQMKLVNLILNAPVNEGRPNVMVVGDDDQAVYKFQGAELSNILNFQKMFNDVEIVTMTNNYRSTQDVLDIATHLIRKGTGRLENLLPEMEKTLISSNKDLGNGDIIHKKLDTPLHELHYVSRKIKELINEGKNPEDIAIIARKHERLEEIVPFLKSVNIPIRYQREQNVFLEPHIEQLITISRFIAKCSRKDMDEADYLLPKILSFPFWQLKRQTVWNISREAYRNNKTWLEVMLDYKEDGSTKMSGVGVSEIAKFLIDLSSMSLYEPLEKVLDTIIGAHTMLLSENEDDEDDLNEEVFDKNFKSPFKDFYFNKEKFEHSRTEYLSFLSSLRVFVRALRDYVGDRAFNSDDSIDSITDYHYLTIEDLVSFVDLRTKNNLPLNDESPFASGEKSVNLLSAHGAKGLEFDTVFVLSCQDQIWAGRGMGNKISMPINMPIQPAGEDETDQLRLFYVAITRAKKHLYLTSYRINESGKESSLLRFLLPDENFTSDAMSVEGGDKPKGSTKGNAKGISKGVTKGDSNNGTKNILETLYNPSLETLEDNPPQTHELLTSSWLSYNTPPFFGEEIELLKILLKEYKLSVTHLNNFLNVKDGGPQKFLEQNLLRFPQAKTISSSYGSAIHKAIERFILYKKNNNSKKVFGANTDANTDTEKTFLISSFVEALKKERLGKKDYEYNKKRGEDALSAFYDQKQEDFNGDDLSEVDFKHEGVMLTDSGLSHASSKTGLLPFAHLTGKIDKIFKNANNQFEVVDFKTGKAEVSWQTSDEDKKIKLNNYKRQLLFYKLLMENSNTYKNSFVSSGILQFVEPIKETSAKGTLKNKIVGLSLDLQNREEEIDRLIRLSCIVYNKILNLDFPDVSQFEPNLKGIIAFEDWLLENN